MQILGGRPGEDFCQHASAGIRQIRPGTPYNIHCLSILQILPMAAYYFIQWVELQAAFGKLLGFTVYKFGFI